MNKKRIPQDDDKIDFNDSDDGSSAHAVNVVVLGIKVVSGGTTEDYAREFALDCSYCSFDVVPVLKLTSR